MTRSQRQLRRGRPSFGRWEINMAGGSVESSIRSDIIGRSVSPCRDLPYWPAEVLRAQLIRSHRDCVELVGKQDVIWFSLVFSGFLGSNSPTHPLSCPASLRLAGERVNHIL